MRILIGILLTLFLLPPDLSGQEPAKYNLELKDTQLETALKQLARLGGFELSYVSEVIPKTTIEESWYNATAESMIFDLLHSYHLEGDIEGRTILIYEMPEEDRPENTTLYYGHITDLNTGEYIVNAYVYTTTGQFAITDNYGLYAIELIHGKDSFITVSNLGYHPITLESAFIPEGRVDVALIPAPSILEPIVITNQEVKPTVLGISEDLIATPGIHNSKTINGSLDIVEQITAQPGAVKMSEGRSGYSVHGTATDQQLILIDEATVFNPTHALGFLSLFASDAMNSASFYKEGLSPKFGGRVGSVLDIRLREGNTKFWTGSLSTNPYTTNLLVEGPVIKDRLSVLASGRASHMNYLLRQVDPVSGFYIPDHIEFYDVIGKINYTISDDHRIFFSGFANADRIRPLQPNNTPFLLYDTEWRNRTFTARWHAIWNDRLSTNTSLVYSDYRYEKSATLAEEGLNYQEQSNIDNRNARVELTYHLAKRQKVLAGIELLTYRFQPASGAITLSDGEGRLAYDIPQIRSNELSIYGEHQYQVGTRLSGRIGLRITSFSNIGNDDYEYSYDDEGGVVDSIFHREGNIIRTFDQVQPRLDLDYQIGTRLLLEAAYNRSTQYIFRLLNENPSSPNEYWLPVGANIRPLVSDALFLHAVIKLSPTSKLRLGGFYRDANGVIAFREGASFLFSESLIDRQVTQGSFESKGIDLEIHKNGKDGYYQLGYAWTDATEQYDDINDGASFAAAQNFVHDLNLQVGLHVSPRATLQANCQWRSGDLISLPTGYGSVLGFAVPIYRERNNYRLPSYQRVDVSMDLDIVKRPRLDVELTAGVYNVFGRYNPYQIRISRDVTLPRLDVLALTRAAPFINLKASIR